VPITAPTICTVLNFSEFLATLVILIVICNPGCAY
jgi:hypothetical protein